LKALLHTRFGDYLFAVSLPFLPCFACVRDFLVSLTDLYVHYQNFFSEFCYQAKQPALKEVCWC